MRQRSRTTLFLFAFLMFQLSYGYAENWPNWRGPRRDGTSTETGLPTKWRRTEKIEWRAPLPGSAAATPAIWGDRIFLTSAEGDNLVLMSLNTSGKTLWKRIVGTGNVAARGDEGNYAAPSPSTDGKYVWAFFSSGDLACFDFAGNQIWKTNLQQRYGKFNLYYVMASTPLLYGNQLYVQLLHTDAQLVLALDKGTGREIWKHERKTDARDECEHSYASPFLYKDGQREYLLIHGADYITAHQLKDGAEVWRCGGLNLKSDYNASLRFVASPVAVAGLVVVPSAKNGPVLGLRPDSKGDITNMKQQYLWKLESGTPDVPSPLIHDGLVYLVREDGELICLDAKTGAKIYHEQTHRTRHRASPVYADGKLYIAARDGLVTVVKAGRKFQILSQNQMGESISASPLISNKRLYLRTYEALYAIMN